MFIKCPHNIELSIFILLQTSMKETKDVFLASLRFFARDNPEIRNVVKQSYF